MSAGGRGRRIGTALGGLFASVLVSTGALAAEAAPAAPAPPPAAEAAPPAAADAAASSETQAAAAQREAQEAEARVIELGRQLGALERERASTDDIVRRLDQIDARQAEAERRAAAGREANPSEKSVVRFRDDGFEIHSPDNGFYLRPRLRLQALYTGELARRGSADPAAPDRSGFSLGRAEIVLEGHVGGPFFQYRLQYDAALAKPLKDAYLVWHPSRLFSIEAGQFKVPYGLERQYWRAELEFIDLSTPMTAFSLERDVGLLLVGRPLPGRLTIQAGLLNGAGAGALNDNLNLAYALRVVATPFGPLPAAAGDVDGHARPLLSLGASGTYNLVPTDIIARSGGSLTDVDLDGDGRVDNVAVWQAGVELRALWRGAELEAEWFGRLEDPGVAGSSRRFWGGYVEASTFILPQRLQLAARLGRTDLPLYGATAAQRLLAGERENEQSAAVSAYPRGHRVKAQMDYSHLTTDGTSAPEAHRIRAALQVGF